MSYTHETKIVESAKLGAALDARVRDGWDVANLLPMDDGLVLIVFRQWQTADEREPFVVDKNMFAATKNKKPVDSDGFGWAPALPKTFIDEVIPFDAGEENVDGFAR